MSNAGVEERLRCAKLVYDAYIGAIMLGNEDAIRCSGYLLNAVAAVGRRLATSEGNSTWADIDAMIRGSG